MEYQNHYLKSPMNRPQVPDTISALVSQRKALAPFPHLDEILASKKLAFFPRHRAFLNRNHLPNIDIYNSVHSEYYETFVSQKPTKSGKQRKKKSKQLQTLVNKIPPNLYQLFLAIIYLVKHDRIQNLPITIHLLDSSTIHCHLLQISCIGRLWIHPIHSTPALEKPTETLVWNRPEPPTDEQLISKLNLMNRFHSLHYRVDSRPSSPSFGSLVLFPGVAPEAATIMSCSLLDASDTQYAIVDMASVLSIDLPKGYNPSTIFLKEAQKYHKDILPKAFSVRKKRLAKLFRNSDRHRRHFTRYEGEIRVRIEE